MKWMMILLVGLMVLPASHAWEYKSEQQKKIDRARAKAKGKAPKVTKVKPLKKFPEKARVARSKKFRGLKMKGPRVMKGYLLGEKNGHLILRSGFGVYHLNKDSVVLRNKKTFAKKGFRMNRLYSLRVSPRDIKSKKFQSHLPRPVLR